MDVVNCLNNIVGIARDSVPCFSGSLDASFTTSESGRYVTDFEDGIPLTIPAKIEDCEQTDWEIISQAKELANRDFLTDFAGELGSFYRMRFDGSEDPIGDYSKSTGLYFERGNYHSIKISSKVSNPDLCYVVSQFRFWVGGSGDFNWYVFRNDSSTPIESGTVTAAAWSFQHMCTVTFNTPLELTTEEGYEYYFVYQSNNFYPVDTRFHCGCSGRLPAWTKYFEGRAAKVDDLATIFDTDHTHSTQSFGIQVVGYLKCNAFGFLCNEMDYVRNPWAAVLAKVLQLYTVRKIIQYILSDPAKINIYTTVLRDDMIKKIEDVNEKIASRMPYLVSEVPSAINNCYYCHNQFYQRKSIRV